MNQSAKLMTLRSFFLTCLLNLFTIVLWAQDNQGTGDGGATKSTTTTTTSKTNINLSSDSNAWYTQPWVWIVGAAVFILLLVALLSGSRGRDTVSSDRVTVKKTVERDTTSDI